MPTYNTQQAQYETMLILASRSISDLAIQLAQQAGEEVGPLPSKEQFQRAWDASQEQVGWLLGSLEALLDRLGLMKPNRKEAMPDQSSDTPQTGAPDHPAA